MPANPMGVLWRRRGRTGEPERPRRVAPHVSSVSESFRRIVFVTHPIMLFTRKGRLGFQRRELSVYSTDRAPCSISLRALLLLACLGLPLSLLAQAPPGKERVDLLITGGTVVTMDVGKRTLEGGA